VRPLLEMLGRTRADLDEHLLLSLCNSYSMVLQHLQYCLMVWGDFEVGRNRAYGETLLKLQKRFVGLITGKGGRYHADTLFAGYGILKVGDLHRQQLTLHAWRFPNGRLPDGQMVTLRRVDELHSYGTRSARGGLVVGSGDQRQRGGGTRWLPSQI
jgi:hypothetical protein